RLRFSGPKTSIICSPMTSLKTSIKTITYLSDTGCLEIQGASLVTSAPVAWHVPHENIPASRRVNADFPFIKYSINRLLKA
ncbi:hypothetical protein, partial [Escherichia coli]|uniref:hypothetical protein n=1 Tax=Escherichia coli TaxID=562 RepID=UPI001BDB9D7F